MRTAMMDVAEEYVLAPVRQELAEYSDFCNALSTLRD